MRTWSWRRAALAVVIFVALSLVAAGCGGGSGGDDGGDDASGTTTTASDGSSSSSAPDASATTAVSGGDLVPMATSTEDEETALAMAMTPEGRKWAAGNPDGSIGAAEGEAVLCGYVVKLDDGTTQYQVKVLNGTAVPFFRTSGDAAIASPYDAYYTTVAPQSEQQEVAVTSATAALASTAPAATAGGIDSYVFYFPKTDEGKYPHVEVYADRSQGLTWAAGGAEFG